MEDNSIKKYGGYYIGRYETGCDEERNSSSGGNIEQIAKIQLDLNVYNYITSDESVEVAERMYEGKSRLCSSYAWDTALKFIDGESGTYSTNSQGDNYNSLKKTGNYYIKNIYDMGGNIRTWTTEVCTQSIYPCVLRRRIFWTLTIRYTSRVSKQ